MWHEQILPSPRAERRLVQLLAGHCAVEGHEVAVQDPASKELDRARGLGEEAPAMEDLHARLYEGSLWEVLVYEVQIQHPLVE